MKTLYSKMMLLSLSALIIGFIILSIGLNVAFKTYLVEREQAEMIDLAVAFNDMIAKEAVDGVIDSDVLISELTSLEKYSKLRVWLLIDDKFYSPDPSMNIDIAQLSQDDIEKVVSTGEAEFRSTQYLQFPDTQFYSLIYPIHIKGETVTIIYLNKAVPTIDQKVDEFNHLMIVALVIALIYSGITIFISTRRVSGDIKKLNNGVKFIAKGNFDYEFNTQRDDEIGELSRNFNLMVGELKAMENSRRKFISDLSHDLRSPITSIRGYIVGVLDGTIPPEKWDKYLNIAREETDRLTKLINDILDLSKMQAGELSVNKSEFDIHDLLFNILDRFEERIHKKSVNVKFKLLSGDVTVLADYSLIERVVYNLLDNAVKFIDENGTLEIMTSHKGDKMLVGIRNTGAVIPSEKLSHIWQRFSKLDSSRGMVKNSSGLGLSIIKEILDAHGEKIDVYSNENLGVMFVFSLSKVNKN